VVTAQNVPQILRGIGTVQAFNTVTVKSQVDGAIVKVAFTEGQEVNKGDLLFQIDPRPYQATLALATANKEKDQAQLATAQADLVRYGKLVGSGFQTRQSFEQQQGLVAQFQAAIKGDEAQIDTAHLNLGYTDIRSPIDGGSARGWSMSATWCGRPTMSRWCRSPRCGRSSSASRCRRTTWTRFGHSRRKRRWT